MKKLIAVFFAMSLSLSGCGEADSDFDFQISPSTFGAIKSTAISCISKKNAVQNGTVPSYDVSANFVQIKGLTFAYENATKALIIDTIEFKIDGIALTVGGDELLALNAVWWSKGEAVVGGPLRSEYNVPSMTYTPATLIKADCPLYLSGLPSGAAYQKSGTATVYGRFEDAAGNQESAQAVGFVTITWRGD